MICPWFFDEEILFDKFSCLLRLQGPLDSGAARRRNEKVEKLYKESEKIQLKHK